MRETSNMEEFRAVIRACELDDLGYQGFNFTWVK